MAPEWRPEAAIDIIVPEFREVHSCSSNGEACNATNGVCFTMYRVDCYAHGRKERIATSWHRYSEFVKFNKELAAIDAPLVSLPPKKPFGCVDVESRRVWLQCALQTCIQSHNALPPPIAKFLQVPSEAAERIRACEASVSTKAPVSNQKSVTIAEQMSSPLGSRPSDLYSTESEANAVANSAMETAAVKSAMDNADLVLQNQELHSQLTRLATALLVAVAPLYMSSHVSLSMLLLGACSSLWLCICISRKDTDRRLAAMQVVKDQVGQLSAGLRTATGSFSSACKIAVTGSFSSAYKTDNYVEGQTSKRKVRSDSISNQVALDWIVQSSSPSILLPSVKPLPEGLKLMADDSFEMLTRNLRDDVNAYGLAWEIAKGGDNPQIWCSKVPGETRKVWKMHFTFASSLNLEQLLESMMIWDERLKWDETMAHGEFVQTFENGYEISQYHTKPILTVSSREFVDFRGSQRSADESSALTFFSSLTSHDVVEVGSELPSPTKGMVRGENKMGSGHRLTLLPEPDTASGKNKWKFEVIAEADPKGWIPTTVINKAFTMTLTDNAKLTTNYFGQL